MFMVIRDVAAIVCAVCNVTVDEEIRLPFIPELQPGARLGRVGFHVVAIEVLVRACRAPAHVGWTVLVDAVVRTGALVTVGVVDWDE